MDFMTKVKMVRTAEDMTIPDFADLCNLSVPAYGALERGGDPSLKSRNKIERGVDRLGWSLLDDGVVKRQKTYHVLKGDGRYHALFDDIAAHANPGTELLIDGAEESKTPADILDRVRAIRAKGIKMRHLIREGDTDLRAPLSEYRYMPASSFINQVIFIYGRTVAIDSGEEEKIHIHRNASLFISMRNKFNMLWDMFPEPAVTEAINVFDL